MFSTIRFLYNSQRKSTSMCISNIVEDKQQVRTSRNGVIRHFKKQSYKTESNIGKT